MTDLRIHILTALAEQPLKRRLPRTVPGESLERVLARHGVTVFEVASLLGSMRSGPWPLIEVTDWDEDCYRITEAGKAQLAWVQEIAS